MISKERRYTRQKQRFSMGIQLALISLKKDNCSLQVQSLAMKTIHIGGLLCLDFWGWYLWVLYICGVHML